MILRASIVFAAVAIISTSAPASASDCVDVYQNATRNIDSFHRQQTELNYYFNQHCQQDGSVNKSSLGISAVIYQIPITLSGSNDQEKMEQFCKIGRQQNYFQDNLSSYANHVVVPALSSFNECKRIENQGLEITYTEQTPRSVIIHGEITKNTLNATLDVVSYDRSQVTCTSPDFGTRSVTLGPGDAARQITKNFNIECTRIPVTKDAKSAYFPPVKIGIATSVGTLTVSLAEDRLNGFFLASEAKAKFDAAMSNLNDTMRDINLLQDRMKNASVKMYRFYQGNPGISTWQTGRRYGCPNESPLNAIVKSLCKDKKAFLERIAGGISGGDCGYDYYNLACLELDESLPSKSATK